MKTLLAEGLFYFPPSLEKEAVPCTGPFEQSGAPQPLA